MDALVFWAFGLLLLWLGAFMLYDNSRKLLKWHKVEAQVTAHLWEPKSHGDSNQTAYEQLQYISATGETITTKSTLAVATPNDIGNKVTIYYNPADLKQVMVRSVFRLYGPPIVLLCFGCVFLASVW